MVYTDMGTAITAAIKQASDDGKVRRIVAAYSDVAGDWSGYSVQSCTADRILKTVTSSGEVY